MGRAKEIKLAVINSSVANGFIKKHHYSGKVVNNSQLHFGAYLDDRLHGAMSFGPSTDKSKIIKLVSDTGWNEFIELNRMAFDDYLPRNAESRCMSMAIKLIKKNAPHIKWIISFADGTQCGDGTIYRASNFVLTGIKKNSGLRIYPKTGEFMHSIQAYHLGLEREFYKWQALPGFQLRYIYFIDLKCREKLTVPILPFSKIDELGAGMYKGEKITYAERNAMLTEMEKKGGGI
jgi:hypothetical protein